MILQLAKLFFRCFYTCLPSLTQSTQAVDDFHSKFPSILQTLSASVNKVASSNSVVFVKPLTLQTMHDRLGHASLSKLVHVSSCKHLNASEFFCDSCKLAKAHRLPFPHSSIHFDLIHVDLWGPYKAPALNGAHYFFTIVDDKSRATWTYLVHSKEQILTILTNFLQYIWNHFKAKPKFHRSDNGTEIVNTFSYTFF